MVATTEIEGEINLKHGLSQEEIDMMKEFMTQEELMAYNSDLSKGKT